MTLPTPLSCSSSELAARLRQGEAAIFPTDTLPALAAAPQHADQLWRLKQRPLDKPVILMGADAEELFALLGVTIEPAWRHLAARHWPGALTLVLPSQGTLTEQLNPAGNSLGLRIPACKVALELLELSGPLATTSANASGEPPCINPEQASARFPGVAQLAPLPWPEPSGEASTVVRWRSEATGDTSRWQVLRAGAVMPTLLQDATA